MASNKLILRNTASPYTFPYPDIVKGSVLSWADGDNNFIFLKGLAIQDGSYDSGDSTITLNRIDGTTIEISGITGGGGGSGATMFVSTDNYTSGVTRTITHNLGTENVMVQLNYDDELVFGEVTNYQTNSVDVTLNQTLNNVKTLVLGGPITSGGTGGPDVFVTGGTYTGSTIIFTNNSGGTFSVTGITGGGGGGTDVFVTGGTYSAGTMEFTNNTGGTFNVSGFSANTIFSSTDNYVSGVTQTINHNLNTKDIIAQLIDTSNNELIVGYISNYQLNSVDVELTDTLNDIKIVIVGSGAGGSGSGTDIFVSGGTYSASTLEFTNTSGGTFQITGVTGGGTGSTSPGGANTNVQYNNSGTFGGNSNFTYDSATGTLINTSQSSGRTLSMGSGTASNPLGTFFGHGISYDNPSSSGHTLGFVGDLTTLGGADDSTLLGFVGSGFSEQYLYTTNKGSTTSIARDENDEYSNLTLTPSGATLQLNTTGTTNFLVTDSGGDAKFGVDSDGNVGINSAFQFPNGDGSSGQVMVTNGGGVLSWQSVSGGGSSIIIVGGGSNSTLRCGLNNIASGEYSATLGGNFNASSGACSTISGGYQNTATGYTSAIGGGCGNVTLGDFSTIGGGCGNQTNGTSSIIGGGQNNETTSNFSTIGGGYNHEACGPVSTIAGGGQNKVLAQTSTIGGGYQNCIDSGGVCSIIGGGYVNLITSACSTIGGGSNNVVSGDSSTISGGKENIVNGECSTISGGYRNLASGAYSSVLGGSGNTASGAYSSVLGGQGLTAGTNTVATPNIDINGDITLIGSTTGGSMTNATITMPTSASTVVTVTLNGTQYGLPLFDLS